jgi:hypothetical protein
MCDFLAGPYKKRNRPHEMRGPSVREAARKRVFFSHQLCGAAGVM